VQLLSWFGISSEKTWHAFFAVANSLALRFQEAFGDGAISSTNYRFAMIDKRNVRQEKLLVALDEVEWRLDVTGLRHNGVRIASDQRSMNRGSLIIGTDWTENYNFRIVGAHERALPTDYRYDTHETVRMMLVEGAPWSATPEYASFRAQLEAGQRPYGLRTFSDLEKRGEKILRLHASLADEGYQTCEDVGAAPWDEAHIYLYSDGTICVGRHGNHRLAIARLLGIERFPAIFGGVHIDFVRELGVSLGRAREAVFEGLIVRDGVEPISH